MVMGDSVAVSSSLAFYWLVETYSLPGKQCDIIDDGLTELLG